MGRRPCCAKEGLNRGAWSSAEDKILVDYINAHGEGKWRDLPRRAGLKRCGKSCRLRWLNYLRPDIKRGNISKEEEDLIIRLHKLLGNRWSLIAGRLPGRTDNEIKNYWNTNLSKKVSGDSSPSDWRRPHCRPRDKKTAAREMDLSQEVIRTKAARCTRIFFPAPPAQEAAAHQTEESGCRETAFPKRDDYLGILHDFDIDELMSNTEELDFLRVSGGDCDEYSPVYCGDGDECAPSSPGRLFFFEEAILEDWRECLQPIATTDLPATVASCLDSEEWAEKTED
ncbi:unnamed protein product [Spirodela intermedia]|uniref:Transcription factor MYB1 n=1 Tax=Spirodela intermedia TaxID=51605 RepID=A0A7I8KAZ7_SPIIN|nr:unnamed protein product [Spirodela intermedia]